MNYKILKKLVLTLIVFTNIQSYELRWDWRTIDTDQISFPANFLWGVAMSDFQNSGVDNCPRNNWMTWERKLDKAKLPKDHFKRAAKACDSWNKRAEDIACTQALGVNSFRLSLEWSNIEPEEGVFNQEAIDNYRNLIDALVARGIKPMITLHHFTNPMWFEKKGAFEKDENIQYFIRYCVNMVEAFHDKVELWTTFNEPGVYVFQTYLSGVWPSPAGFKGARFTLMGQVLRNLMKAHTRTYKALKALSFADTIKIGLVHNITQFDPYHDQSSLFHIVEKRICGVLNHFFYKPVIDFFKTGSMVFQTPSGRIIYNNPEAPKTLDFIGLNYYADVLVNILGSSPAYRTGDIPTDMPYGIYAEGLYRAIQEISTLNVPIYITENGIADDRDDRRELFTKRYLYAVSQALQDGYDIRGFFYWSLLDNFEWSYGYVMKFGLYEVNFGTQERKLRKGARYYQQIVKRHTGR